MVYNDHKASPVPGTLVFSHEFKSHGGVKADSVNFSPGYAHGQQDYLESVGQEVVVKDGSWGEFPQEVVPLLKCQIQRISNAYLASMIFEPRWIAHQGCLGPRYGREGSIESFPYTV